MAVTSGFFNAIDHDRQYNAEDVGSLLDGIITDGILNTYGSHFEVTRVGENSLDVIVGSGRGWFKQTWILNDDNLTLTAEQNTTTKTRYDSVVIDINKTDNIRANSIQIVTGTDDPAGPTLIDDAAHKQYAIANIQVAADNSGIENVVDRRDEIYAQNPSVLKPYWPVGSIFMTMDINFDPTVAFGGTWEQISGRFLIGCGGDSGLTVGETGGSWEHTITTDHLPSHNHATGTLSTAGVQLTPKLYRVTDGQQINYVMGWADSEGTSRGGGGTSNYLPASWNYPYSYQGAQNMSEGINKGPSAAVTDETYVTLDTHSHSVYGNTANTGNGQAITIKPPFLAVYMWKRIS